MTFPSPTHPSIHPSIQTYNVLWSYLSPLFFGWDGGLNSGLFTTWATPSAHFALVILEMGSLELFAWAALEPQSSHPQPPK
jgi:hypothetical protein